MMKRTIALLAVLSLTVTRSATAQKLPNVQEISLRAPAGIKVDGKPTEWNNQFQAYNKATDVFYTISNDNDKLYLTLKAKNLDIINKIVSAGITLTINGSGKMKDQEGAAITFPALNEDSFPRDSHGTAYVGPAIILDKPENLAADSFMVKLNKELTSKLKDIQVIGIKEIPDRSISIYNPYGIKAAAFFDYKEVFTYELAVPLKHLGLSVDAAKAFVYNIKLPGMNPDMSKLIGYALRVQRPALRGLTNYGMKDGILIIEGPTVPRLKQILSPTDFWGEYTLAK